MHVSFPVIFSTSSALSPSLSSACRHLIWTSDKVFAAARRILLGLRAPLILRWRLCTRIKTPRRRCVLRLELWRSLGATISRLLRIVRKVLLLCTLIHKTLHARCWEGTGSADNCCWSRRPRRQAGMSQIPQSPGGSSVRPVDLFNSGVRHHQAPRGQDQILRHQAQHLRLNSTYTGRELLLHGKASQAISM